jgi:hypothetical protein
MSDDATVAYLFQCGDSDFFAVSHDITGANIPREECVGGWSLRGDFLLGVQEPVPVAVDPEPLLRGMVARGFFVWRAGNVNKTSATSQ